MNNIDTLCLAVVGFSLIIGLIQGFTLEVFRFITWSGASAAAYYGHSLIEPFLIPFVTKGIFLQGVSIGCTFIATLIALNIFSHTMVYKIRGSLFRGIDNILGMLLGGGRGIGIIAVVYALLLTLNPPGHQFTQFKHSKIVPFIEFGFLEMAHVMPHNTRLKELKTLIIKRQKAEHVASVPVVSHGSSAIKSLMEVKKNHTFMPPPLARRPFFEYVKELFQGDKDHSSEQVHPRDKLLTKNNYSSHQKENLN